MNNIKTLPITIASSKDEIENELLDPLETIVNHILYYISSVAFPIICAISGGLFGMLLGFKVGVVVGV